MKLNLTNLSRLGRLGSDYFDPFSFEIYTFNSTAKNMPASIYNPVVASRNNRNHKQNAFVEFIGKQPNSILFKGGLVGNELCPRKRKFIEDILILGSILTHSNWSLFSRKNHPYYPITPVNHLRPTSTNVQEIKEDLIILINKLRDTDWQLKYNNGFHLIILLNNSNINNRESRFLSNIVLWEFLYAKIFGFESENLHEIIKSLLEYFWPGRINSSVFLNGRIKGVSKNIYYVLRNQLAHSGKLPIDRVYAEDWMKLLPFSTTIRTPGDSISDYLTFFDELTQIIVMKTLDFHPEQRSIFNAFNFSEHLNKFLSTGKIN